MEEQCKDLYEWIEKHTISRPKRNLSRDFADAMPLVEILKVHFPKLVQLHSYSPKNSFSQKLINWETVNNKVLKKIKINLGKKRMEQLAKAEPGAIEQLLLEIKKKIETKTGNDDYEISYLDEVPPSVTKIESVTTKKVISQASFDKLQTDLDEKTETLTILKNKLDHLENLLNIKEERIKDLTSQVETLANQTTRPQSGPKFFGSFFQSASVRVASDLDKSEYLL